MVLPEGVFQRASSRCLIAKNEQAVIRIETEPFVNNKSYEIENRYFEDLTNYIKGAWAEFDKQHDLERNPQRLIYDDGGQQESPVIYSIARYKGKVKLPSITVVPNLETKKNQGLATSPTLLGSSMGHYYRPCAHKHKTQAIYEFHSYGMLAMLTDAHSAELWVAREGDKVAVPGGSHITLYNLGDEYDPLVTLDFSCSETNPLDDELAQRHGPIALIYYNDFEVTFQLNQDYIADLNQHTNSEHPEPLFAEDVWRITTMRDGRWPMGRMLYEKLTTEPSIIGQFARVNITIKKASPEVILKSTAENEEPDLYFSSPLTEAIKRGEAVQRYFLQEVEIELNDAKQSIAEVVSEMAKEKHRVIRNARLKRRADDRVYRIVIEGVGDWVEQSYLPLLRNKRTNLKQKIEDGDRRVDRELQVYYVNDSRWKAHPKWVDEIDDEWEIYLDKAQPDDLSVYEIINPDVVFIATPDSTHSEIAQWWLFKTPLVFIEKPFDSHVSNVHDLLRMRGRGLSPRDPKGQYDTNVFGLDHWQFYALPIYELRSEIEKHLDGELTEVVFFMTEGRAIEFKRDRSLQHGLTLDLLPHLLALLTYFGDVRTVDEIQVLEVGQYEPLYSVDREVSKQEDISQTFHTETFSRLRFTFRDYSGTGRHISCTSEVGKGRVPEKKYLEIKGRSGNSIRVDFKDIKGMSEPDFPNYPYNHLFFLVEDPKSYPTDSTLQCVNVPDPYDDQKKRVLFMLEDKTYPGSYRHQLDRHRYSKLLDELLYGTEALLNENSAAASTLSLAEGEEVVRALDFIWRAVQNRQSFVKYALPENAYISP